MPGKYTPLKNYLASLPPALRETTLPLEQIESITGNPVPPSAHQYNAFWSYEKKPRQPHKLAILEAGWKVETINITEKWVRLIRM